MELSATVEVERENVAAVPLKHRVWRLEHGLTDESKQSTSETKSPLHTINMMQIAQLVFRKA